MKSADVCAFGREMFRGGVLKKQGGCDKMIASKDGH